MPSRTANSPTSSATISSLVSSVRLVPLGSMAHAPLTLLDGHANRLSVSSTWPRLPCRKQRSATCGPKLSWRRKLIHAKLSIPQVGGHPQQPAAGLCSVLSPWKRRLRVSCPARFTPRCNFQAQPQMHFMPAESDADVRVSGITSIL